MMQLNLMRIYFEMEIKINIPDIEKLPFIEVTKPLTREVIQDFKMYGKKVKRKYKINSLTNLQIPRKQGIYFLYNREKELIYIGETLNLFNRMSNHRIEIPTIFYIKFFELNCLKRTMIGIEQILIDRFKPKLQEITTVNQSSYRVRSQLNGVYDRN